MSEKDTYSKAAEAFNRDDCAAFAGLYASDAVVFDPLYAEPLRGRAAIEQDVADVRRALPDARFAIRSVMEAGDRIAGEYTLTGTHLGPLATPDGEVPPTGRTLELHGAVFSRLSPRGEVVEEHRYYDIAGMLAQLGLDG